MLIKHFACRKTNNVTNAKIIMHIFKVFPKYFPKLKRFFKFSIQILNKCENLCKLC